MDEHTHLPLRQARSVTGPKEELVHPSPSSPPLLLVTAGDVEDHAVLLCSLLLGFGLDAYVAVGTRLDKEGVEEEHAWVVTRTPREVADPTRIAHVEETHVAWGAEGRWKVTFWESTSGEAVQPSEALSSGHRFFRVGCVFNHGCFFANQQREDTVTSCRWELEDPTLWKPVSDNNTIKRESDTDECDTISMTDFADGGGVDRGVAARSPRGSVPAFHPSRTACCCFGGLAHARDIALEAGE